MCLEHRPKINMPDSKVEGIDTPVSPETKQAIEELQAEGNVIDADNKPNFEGEDIKDKPLPPKEPAKTDKKPEEKQPEEDEPEEGDEPESDEEPKDETPKDEDEKPARDIKFVPAWKLKTAESQKASVEKQLADANAELARLAGKPSDLNSSDKKDLGDALKVIAEKHNVDPELLKDLRDTIVGQVSTPAEITEKLKQLDKLTEENDRTFQESQYLKEFDKDVAPLIKAENPDISEDALLQAKEALKKLAFTEEYGKLSLAKIFKAERDSLGLPVASPKKKATENSRSGTDRTADVPFDDLDEAGFAALSDEKAEEYLAYMAKKNRK